MLIVFYVVCALVFIIILYSFYKGMNTTVTSNSGANLGSMALSGFKSGLNELEKPRSSRSNNSDNHTSTGNNDNG